jgi:CBS domain-containing protein
MNASFVALHYATPPEQIDRVVAQKNVGSDIPLIDENGKLVGLYSSNSYRRPEIDLSDENLYADPDADLLAVMRKIDMTGLGIALVVENRKLIGLVTDKDIRLSISHGMPLQTSVKEIMNRIRDRDAAR